MELEISNILKDEFGIDNKISELAQEVEKEVHNQFEKVDDVRQYNQLKVIKAMQKNQLSDSHFSGTTGYGYDDRGREVLDRVYADVFKAEDALVRHQIVSGTQALAICLYGNLRPGDELLSITGKPYDTLEEVIGIRGSGAGSLKDFGITYKQVELDKNNKIDLESVKNAINERTSMVLIQRSRGYGWRPPIFVDDIEAAVKYIKEIKKDIIVMVDNCYGEFVEKREPIEAGADIIAGSLIKNPGGGLAPTGGYVAGKKKYVENAAYRLTSPGIGREVGASLGHNRLLFQGFFMAPHVVAESIKGAIFAAAFMKKLGFDVSPDSNEKRSDIIQAIRFNSQEPLIAFCQGIQKGSPVDAYVTPQPWDMPGYDSQVIMAAGAFVQGASIELSADAPIKPPYIAYLQGGLVYEHARLGVMMAVQLMSDRGIINI